MKKTNAPEPFSTFAARVLEAITADAEQLFTAAFGPPERPGAARLRSKKGAAVMERHGAKRGLWMDHSAQEGGGPAELFSRAQGGPTRLKGAAYRQMIEAAAARYGITRRGAITDPAEAAAWEAERRRKAEEREAKARKSAEDAAEDERQRLATAAAFIAVSVALDAPASAPGRAYPASRGLDLPPVPDLRFIPANAFTRATAPRGALHASAPALLVILRDAAGAVAAVQRITIRPDGSDRDRERGKVYSGVPSKTMGLRIPARADDATSGALILAEGLESALAVWTATGAETWCGVDAGGLARLIEKAPARRRVIVASDRDAPGNTARITIDAAAAELGRRHPDAWRAMPSPSRIPVPAPGPGGKIKDGADAADLLKAHGRAAVLRMIEEEAQKIRARPEIEEERADELRREDEREAAPLPSPKPEPRRQIPEANFHGPRLVTLPPDPDAPPIFTREEAAPIIAAALARFVTDADAWRGTDRSGPAPVHVLRVTAGAGKTAQTRAAVAAYVRANPGARITIASPTVELGRDELAAFRKEAPDIPAMQRLGRTQTDPETGAPMCGRSAEVEVEEVAKIAPSIQTALCTRKGEDGQSVTCPLFAVCAYQRQLRALPEARVVFETHAHMTSRAADPDTAPAFRVIDEDPVDSLIRARAFSPELLRAETKAAFYGAARRLKNTAADALLKKIGDAAPRMDRAQGIILRALEDDPSGETVIERLRAKGFTAADAAHFAEVQSDRAPRPALSPTMTAAEIRAERKRIEAAQAESGALALRRLWLILARDWSRGFSQAITMQTTQTAQGEVRKIAADYLRTIPRDVPTLILDATATAEIVRAVWPGAVIEDVRVWQQAEIWQVIDRTTPNSWQTGGMNPTPERAAAAARRRASLRTIIGAVAEKVGGAENVAFAAPASAIRLHLSDTGAPAPEDAKPGELRAHQIDGADALPFGPHLRGLNTHASKTALIVAGRHRPPPASIEARARAIFTSGPRLTFGRTERVRAYDAAPGAPRYGVELSCYEDDRVQAVAESITGAMSAQTAGRLRLVHRTAPALIIVICAEPIPGVIPTRLVRLDEITPSRLRAAHLAHRAAALSPGAARVFDLSPRALSESAPEIFPTPKAADRHLARADELTPVSLKESLWGNGGQFPTSDETQKPGLTLTPLKGVLWGNDTQSTDPGAEIGEAARRLISGPFAPSSGFVVSYRARGQRGREERRAFIDAPTAEEAAAILEEQRGELSAFRVLARVGAAPEAARSVAPVAPPLSPLSPPSVAPLPDSEPNPPAPRLRIPPDPSARPRAFFMRPGAFIEIRMGISRASVWEACRTEPVRSSRHPCHPPLSPPDLSRF